MIYPAIIQYPDQKLRNISKEVTLISFESALKTCAMLKECVSLYHGLGLAAPQLGRNDRIIVVLDSVYYTKTIMINPVITEHSQKLIPSHEGCLSIKDTYLEVTRYSDIKVSYIDENGKAQMKSFGGSNSCIVQHEIDHLDGILIIDKGK